MAACKAVQQLHSCTLRLEVFPQRPWCPQDSSPFLHARLCTGHGHAGPGAGAGAGAGGAADGRLACNAGPLCGVGRCGPAPAPALPPPLCMHACTHPCTCLGHASWPCMRLRKHQRPRGLLHAARMRHMAQSCPACRRPAARRARPAAPCSTAVPPTRLRTPRAPSYAPRREREREIADPSLEVLDKVRRGGQPTPRGLIRHTPYAPVGYVDGLRVQVRLQSKHAYRA